MAGSKKTHKKKKVPKKAGKKALPRKTAAKKKTGKRAPVPRLVPPAPRPAPPAQNQGRFELRIILLVVALLAGYAAFSGLKKSRGPADIAAVAMALNLAHATTQLDLAGGQQRILIRSAQTISRNQHIWVDVLPPGSFMPPRAGANDYTVLDHNFGDDMTALYQQGPWEGRLRRTLEEKSKKK
jgi:hypothetical protein